MGSPLAQGRRRLLAPSSVMLLCAVSVDLDEIPNYHALYGLAPPIGQAARLVYDVALERLERFARAHDLPLTLFAIGADLERAENAERLGSLARAGHEVANHTQDHFYDLTRRSSDEIARQVELGASAIEKATGRRPVGFRAPGYTVTDQLFEVLAAAKVRYDSSVFPCPPYYAAKAAARLAVRVRGGRSRSILDNPRVLLAPHRPYRIGQPYWHRGSGILELPIQVTRGLRLPFIGTTLTMAGPARARWLTRAVVGEPLVNLELHGLDVLDADDGFPELVGRQPDAAIVHARKLEALSATVSLLRDRGYAFVRLEEAAAAFG